MTTLLPAPLVSSMPGLDAGARWRVDAGTRGSATHTRVEGRTLHGHVVPMVGHSQ